MTVQVLVSTMYQKDFSLLDRMNIQTDTIVINQCDKNSQETFQFKNNTITWICTEERGVGKSRNRAIIASSADILLFADDDVVYDDGAIDKVDNYFMSNRDVSLCTFNIQSLNPERPEIIVRSDYRLHFWNCLKFGASRIAVRRADLLKNNVFFSLLFGGGAYYQFGEDNHFIMNCLQRSMKCKASSIFLGTVAQDSSTWFKGYDKKYYQDRGALFYSMFGGKTLFVLLLFEIKHMDNRFFYKIKNEIEGMHNYKKTTKYCHD